MTSEAKDNPVSFICTRPGTYCIIMGIISSLADCASVIDDINEGRFSFLCHFVWIQFSPQWMALGFGAGSAGLHALQSVRDADAINEHEMAKKRGHLEGVEIFITPAWRFSFS